MPFYLHYKQANYHGVLTKDFRLCDTLNYKKSKGRSDCKAYHLTPLLRYSSRVTEWGPNCLEKHLASP